jgi:hypothetical protein
MSKEIQEKITLSVSQSDKVNLEKLATKLGYVRGEKPSISALLRAIAQGEVTLDNKAKISQANYIISKFIQEISQLKLDE